jgi:DNA-binding GntR family transcriptional regulator
MRAIHRRNGRSGLTKPASSQRGDSGPSSAYLTKSDSVQRLIRQAIARGDIQPGERLLQNELAERLGVSPTPVREALIALVAQGVLRYLPNRGMRVVELDAPDAEQVYLIRGQLEPLAVELGGPHLSQADLDELAGVLAAMRRAADQTRLERVKLLDHRFHFLIYGAAGRGRLHDMIEHLRALHVEDTFKLDPERVGISLSQHAAIFAALEEGRFSEASAITREHIASAGRIVVAHLREHAGADPESQAGQTD